MAADILKTYKRLGKDWLFEVAKTRPDLFINQCLSRLLPPAFKDGADMEFNQQISIGMSDAEAARRIAFVLAKAVHDDPSRAIDITPVTTMEPVTLQRPDPSYPKRPPTGAPPLVQPEPVDDPERREWAASLPLTAEERRDQLLIKETITGDLSSYRGSSAEQGAPGPTRSPTSAAQDPRAAQRDRLLARRRKQLL